MHVHRIAPNEMISGKQILIPIVSNMYRFKKCSAELNLRSRKRARYGMDIFSAAELKEYGFNCREKLFLVHQNLALPANQTNAPSESARFTVIHSEHYSIAKKIILQNVQINSAASRMQSLLSMYICMILYS